MDNRLSAKLTASSGRDSIAMKILAAITAMFLPGTFVAVSLNIQKVFSFTHFFS